MQVCALHEATPIIPAVVEEVRRQFREIPELRPALIAAESYAEAAGDMARLMGKGGLDHNAGGFIRRSSEAREIDEAMRAGLAG